MRRYSPGMGPAATGGRRVIAVPVTLTAVSESGAVLTEQHDYLNVPVPENTNLADLAEVLAREPGWLLRETS